MSLKTTLLLFLAVWILWDVAVPAFGIRQRPPWALKKILAQSPPPVLLDVRTPQEFGLFHIPGAINRPAPLMPSEDMLRAWQGREVVVICMTGHRSPIMAWKLKKAGLNASNLTWGMAGWKLLGGATTRKDE